MSSMMNSQIHPRGKKEIKEKENIIFENANFVNQFKELKNAFDTCENNKMNNGDKNTKKINDYNFIDFYTKYRENNKGKITKNRKLNSVKLNKTSLYRITTFIFIFKWKIIIFITPFFLYHIALFF